MVQVTIVEDCGNSPKNIFLQNTTVAFARWDIPALLGSIAEEICWEIPGDKVVHGKDEFARLPGWFDDEVTSLSVLHVMTHGRAGAVDGRVKLHSGKVYAYCDVYEFTNVKGERIKNITSYRIEVNGSRMEPG